jgi:hypothetical protein
MAAHATPARTSIPVPGSGKLGLMNDMKCAVVMPLPTVSGLVPSLS